MSTNTIWTAIRRGICRKCPTCGQGDLFCGYLKVRPHCPICGADNGAYPSDDLPPYLTIVIVGHVIIPLFIWVDNELVPPLWVQFSVWLPLTALLTLVLLPFVKGAAVGVCNATGTIRTCPASLASGTRPQSCLRHRLR